jgi:hypothetical protein
VYDDIVFLDIGRECFFSLVTILRKEQQFEEFFHIR